VRPVSPVASGGFTFIEAAVVMAILGILLAVGIPNMSNWMLARKATDAAGFYRDGLALARSQAVANNSASRLVLVDNANGQMDWRVDICFPTRTLPCTDTAGSWSTTNAASANDPAGATAGFRSVVGSASNLPSDKALVGSVEPTGADTVYFTPLGWVDGRMAPGIGRIGLAPSAARDSAFAPMAVALTLAGVASICDPAAAAQSPKACPPLPQ